MTEPGLEDCRHGGGGNFKIDDTSLIKILTSFLEQLDEVWLTVRLAINGGKITEAVRQ